MYNSWKIVSQIWNGFSASRHGVGGLPSPSFDTSINLHPSGDQHRLRPLPTNAYCEPEDVDPLFLAEGMSESDDEFYSLAPEANLGIAPQSSVEQTSRFYGKSSLVAFTTRAFDERGESHFDEDRVNTYREEFWTTPDWLSSILTPKSVFFEFPAMDLLCHLVDCYFDNVNTIYPILHRPSFERSITLRLHESNQSFGAVVLLVCAIGCGLTDDPRVVRVVSPDSSCTAWKLFHQANSAQKRHYLPHSLYDAQAYPLTVVFLEGYSPPDTVWTVIAVGLRIMQDTGVHRKSFSSQKVLETELWKRSFWTLVIFDRSLSTILGRPCALQGEDFDADLPLAYDDEDIDEAGVKPLSQDRQTRMCSFVCMIKLSQILAFTLRTVYSTKRSKVFFGFVGKPWEKRIIATLESALDRWLGAVPDYLQWELAESSKLNRILLLQSAYLRCQFHETQFHVHRSFAFKDPPDPDLSESSIAVCKKAASQCIAIVDSVKEVLLASSYCFGLMKSVFASTMFLTIYSWKTGGVKDDSPERRSIETGTKLIDLTSERCRTFVCLRNLLRIIRGLTEGSHDGWHPNVEDIYRLQVEAVMHVDKEGFASFPTECEKPVDQTGARILTPPARISSLSATQGCERPSTESNDTDTIEVTQPDLLSPIDLLTNAAGFSFGVPASTMTKGREPTKQSDLEGIGEPFVFPMELMMYNDFMMEMGDTGRFFGKDFQDSVLYESAPTPLAAATEDGQGTADGSTLGW